MTTTTATPVPASLFRGLARAFEAGRHTDMSFDTWLAVSGEQDIVAAALAAAVKAAPTYTANEEF